MTSTSEEEEETQYNSRNEWQVIRRAKKEEIHRTQHNTPERKTETHSQYGLLTNETNEDSIDGNPSSTKIHKPPPVFVDGRIDYGEMIKRIRDIAEDEQYCRKRLAYNVIKIHCMTPQTYRKLVRCFRDKNIFYHTYQPKEGRAYRTVIKYLHHSTNTADIKQELFELGHNVPKHNKCTTQNYQEAVKLVLYRLRTCRK
jgi:hypothetical protein